MPGRQTHDRLVQQARIAATNARQPEIALLLADYGFDDEALDALDAALAEAETAMRTQTQEYGEQYAATDRREAVEAEVRALHKRHVKMARLAFAEGTEGHTRLGLGTRRPDATEAFSRTARTFYGTVKDDDALRPDLDRRRLTAATADEALARLDAFDAAVAEQASETGQAQQATATRDAALARLHGLYRDLASTAAVALADRPQLRERLGLLER